MQEALTLAEFASRVIILDRGLALAGQAVYRDRVAAQSKIEVRANTVVEEILGDATVSGVRIRDMSGGTASDLEASGVFVYIGLQPNAAFARGRLTLDDTGRILTDGWMRTELPGVCGAGTVRSGSFGRAASSAGDGATAAIAIDRYLADGTWRERTTRAAALAAVGG
jgi:thioredoxin reductase (NADPH)